MELVLPTYVGEGRPYEPVKGTRLRHQKVVEQLCPNWTCDKYPAIRTKEGYNLVLDRSIHLEGPEIAFSKETLDYLAENLKPTAVMTFEEAVLFLLEESGSVDKMAPAPWNKYGRTKKEVLLNPVARELLRERVWNCKFADWTASLKDEPLPLKQVMLGDALWEVLKDARVFFPASLAYLVAQVMIFGHQNAGLIGHKHIWLGQRTLGHAWDRLAHELMLKSLNGKIIYGDMHKFDSSQTRVHADGVYWARKRRLYMDSWSRAAWENIKQFRLEPIVRFPDGSKWQFSGYNPSGSFNTLSDNCILVVGVFKTACEMYSYDPNDFTFYVTGDDYIFSGPMTAEEWNAACRKLGYITIAQEGTLEEVEFTKLKFRKVDGIWRPIPEFGRVKASLLLNNACDLETIVQTINSALIEGRWLPECEYSEILDLRRNFQNRYPHLKGWISDHDVEALYGGDIHFESNCSSNCLDGDLVSLPCYRSVVFPIAQEA